MDVWHSYIAGFFDGEGHVSIVRQRANGLSDYHKIVVGIGQRAKYRQVLDRICAEFGGAVRICSQKTRLSDRWAEQATWQLQDKRSIEHFLLAMQPYCIVKAAQIALGLEFLHTFIPASTARDTLGRIRGSALSVEEIERRERMRLAMRDANALGPPRAKPSILPPLDLRHRAPTVLVSNPATVERGEQRYNARLTEDAVRAIRAAYAAGGITKAALARQYNVTFMAIQKVLRGETWAHVT